MFNNRGPGISLVRPGSEQKKHWERDRARAWLDKPRLRPSLAGAESLSVEEPSRMHASATRDPTRLASVATVRRGHTLDAGRSWPW